MSRRGLQAKIQNLADGDPVSAFNELIGDCRHRAIRLYRTALAIRCVLVLCSFIAILPDSAALSMGAHSVVYGGIKTGVGLFGGLVYLLARNAKIAETLANLHAIIDHLERQLVKLLAADGLSRQLISLETRNELTSIQARLHRDVFMELDQLRGLGQQSKVGS